MRHDLSKIKFLPGDIFCVKNGQLSSKIVSLLIRLNTGIRNPFTHNELAYSETMNASAEMAGFQILPREKRFEKSKRVVVFRHNGLSWAQQYQIMHEIEKYVGTGYDFFLYLLRMLAALSFFLPLFLYLALQKDVMHFSGIGVALFLMYYPFKNWLEKKEKTTVACSEVCGLVWKELGVLKGVDNPTTLSPDAWFWILSNMKDVECIYDSERD